MQRIIDFVSGKLTYEEFEELFLIDPSIWTLAQSLLTQEILNDDTHPFWTLLHRSCLECNQYSVRMACLAFGYDAYGKMLTYSMLSGLIRHHFPEVVLRYPPDLSRRDLRDRIGMEYLGGKEVDALISEIISKEHNVTGAKLINSVKQELRDAFHLVPRKYPRWVQEPEWPMGEQSPMEFVGQKRDGELVQFLFQDVDTKEFRTVEQLY